MDNIFNVKINMMENVDLDIIGDIERKCISGDSLTQNEVIYFLNYVAYQTRYLILTKKNEDLSYDFNFMCDTAQSIIARYFDRLNISYKPVETQKAILSDVLGHSFILVTLLVDDEPMSYILDPTFNQFFSAERCRVDNFKVINGVVLKTPDLGYFALKSDDNVRKIVKKILKRGYIDASLDRIKIYGDLFYKTKTGKVNYFNSNLEMSGEVYLKGFKNSAFSLSYTEDELIEMGLFLKPVLDLKKNSIKF